MSNKALTERAKHRLRIVAGLLRGVGRGAINLNIPRETFYESIQERIATLTPEQREHLKELTDWVEEFDNTPGAKATNAQGA